MNKILLETRNYYQHLIDTYNPENPLQFYRDRAVEHGLLRFLRTKLQVGSQFAAKDRSAIYYEIEQRLGKMAESVHWKYDQSTNIEELFWKTERKEQVQFSIIGLLQIRLAVIKELIDHNKINAYEVL